MDFVSYASGKQRLGRRFLLFALPSYHLTLIAVLFCLAAHAFFAPVWLSLLGIATLMFQLPAIRAALPKKLYPLLQIVLFVFGVLGLFWGTKQWFGAEFSLSFLLLCLVCKLWELNQKRDGYVVLNLCLFVLASAFLWSQGLGLSLFAVFVLFFVLLGFVALSDDDNHEGKGRFKTLSMLLVPSLPLLVLLFLFFPRLPPLWSLSLPNKQATTGISDSMSPGDFAQLSKSAQLAFRAQFAGHAPSREQLYWRGLVFSEFDGKTWRPAPTVQPQPAPTFDGAALDYRITLEPTHRPWLFLLEHSSVAAQEGMVFLEDFTLNSQRPIDTKFRYEASYVPSAGVFGLSQQQAQAFLALPEGNPKSRQLAQKLRTAAGDDTQKLVQAVYNYVREGNFRYTLSPQLLGEQRVDDFLFGTKAGFCEHYASSFVFLMRSAGVPARVVAGYQGGELAADGKSVEVRQMDAHAWTEVWTQQQGWVRVDPTAFVAPNRIEAGMDALTEEAGSELFGDGVAGQFGYQKFRLLHSLAQLSDKASLYWQQQVVGFDQAEQKKRLFSWFAIKSLVQQLWVLGLGFVIVLLLVWSYVWYGRRPTYHALDAPIAKLSLSLAKEGLAKHNSESYLAYLERILGQDKSLAKTYRAYRFGKQAPTQAQIKEFAKAVASLKKQVKH